MHVDQSGARGALALPPVRPSMRAPNPLRQSSIARFDNCALSLLLEFLQPEEKQRQPGLMAARGALFHRWVSRVLAEMRAAGSTEYPVEMGLEKLLQVLAQRDVPDEDVVHLPMRELRWLRVLVTRWCEGTTRGGGFNAQRIMAIEERMYMPLAVPDGRGGLYERVISGQPDVVVADPPDGVIIVDWKAGWTPPAREVDRYDEDNGEKDQRLSDQGYAQQVIYGALALHELPAISRVTLREAYIMAGEYREATIHRWQLERVLDILGVSVSQIDAAFAAGPDSKRWLPTAGVHCGICPAPRRCPLYDWEGIPTTLAEAQLLAREWIVSATVRKDRLPLLKAWVDIHGPIPIDHGKGRREVGWVPNSTGNGRRFVLYEPEDAPESPFDARMEAVIRDRG
jgi:hypothetical protein